MVEKAIQRRNRKHHVASTCGLNRVGKPAAKSLAASGSIAKRTRHAGKGKRNAPAQGNGALSVPGDVREILDAANQLINTIDLWQKWFSTLSSKGNANPAIAIRYRDECCAAVQALCSHHVQLPPFNEQTPETICLMLPPLPDSSRGGIVKRWDAHRKKWVKSKHPRWQKSEAFRALYFGPEGRFESSLALRSAALKVRKMLATYPQAVLHTPVQPPTRVSRRLPGKDGFERILERVWAESL
jgi:hypothetical protein